MLVWWQALSLSLAAAPATVTGSWDPRGSLQPHTAGETCAPALLAPALSWLVVVPLSISKCGLSPSPVSGFSFELAPGTLHPQEVTLARARLGEAQGCSRACWLRMRSECEGLVPVPGYRRGPQL